MKIFLSYSRDDAGNFAKHIHKYLRDNGYDVFIDVNSITIGEPWADSIEKNISECDIFVIIVTPDSLKSNYVENEVLQAQKQNKIIVPCIHERVEYSNIKWNLNKIQGIEFSDKYELVLSLYPKIKDYTDLSEEKQINMSKEAIPRSNSVEILNEEGNILYKKGKYKEALEYFDKALEIDPTNVNVLISKGTVFLNQNKYTNSLECFDKALEIDPYYVYALNNKGNVLYNLGKYQEAIEWYDKALKVDPTLIVAKTNKKMALEQLSKEKTSYKKRIFRFRK